MRREATDSKEADIISQKTRFSTYQHGFVGIRLELAAFSVIVSREQVESWRSKPKLPACPVSFLKFLNCYNQKM